RGTNDRRIIVPTDKHGWTDSIPFCEANRNSIQHRAQREDTEKNEEGGKHQIAFGISRKAKTPVGSHGVFPEFRPRCARLYSWVSLGPLANWERSVPAHEHGNSCAGARQGRHQR